MTFKTERDSIEYICNYFEKKGFKATPTQTDNQYCHYDITCTRGDKVLWLELKRRNHNLSKYGDSVIEKHKYDFYKQSKQECMVDGVIVISLFTDCWCMSNAFTPVEFFDRKCKHHTEFWDNTIITHHFVKYKPEIILCYD